MARDSGEPGAPGITRDGPERHLDASARHPGDHRDPPAGCRHRRTSGQLLPTVSTRHPGRAHRGNLTRQRGCGRFRKPRNSLSLQRTFGARHPPQRIDRRSAGRRTHRADPGRAFHRPPLRGAVLPGTNPHQYPDTEIENAGTWNYLSSLGTPGSSATSRGRARLSPISPRFPRTNPSPESSTMQDSSGRSVLATPSCPSPSPTAASSNLRATSPSTVH